MTDFTEGGRTRKLKVTLPLEQVLPYVLGKAGKRGGWGRAAAGREVEVSQGGRGPAGQVECSRQGQAWCQLAAVCAATAPTMPHDAVVCTPSPRVSWVVLQPRSGRRSG